MGPLTTKLVLLLDQAVQKLKTAEALQWADYLAKSKEYLGKGDYSGIEMILGLPSGPGTISDMCLGEDFDKLAVEIENLAAEIKKQAEIENL